MPLQLESGHLAKTSTGHLAMCSCTCCKEYEFTSETELASGPCGNWDYSITHEVTMPSGVVSACYEFTSKVIGTAEIETTSVFTHKTDPSQDEECVVTSEWDIEVIAEVVGLAVLCRLRYRCTASTATGSGIPGVVDPAGCQGFPCDAYTVGTVLYSESQTIFDHTEEDC